MIVLDGVYIRGQGDKCIQVDGGIIQSVADVGLIPAKKTGGVYLNGNGYLAFPGLINSHDHLDFNLFPPLGNRKYNNYVEWGEDIHAQNKQEIAAVLKIPQSLRTQWGVYKNLLNGITTVVNHGQQLQVDTKPL